MFSQPLRPPASLSSTSPLHDTQALQQPPRTLPPSHVFFRRSSLAHQAVHDLSVLVLTELRIAKRCCSHFLRLRELWATGDCARYGVRGVTERRDLMEPASVPAMAAFVIGGSGMVGRKLIAELAQSNHFTRIVTLGRREVPYDGPGKEKLSQHVVDFDNLDDEQKSLLSGLDVGFNTMGTTSADAGSPEKFTKIDHDIPLHVARLFKEANPSKPLHFCLLSAGGASASSSMLYPRTKGLLEQHVTELGFAKLSVFRPGLLVYEDAKREKMRIGEAIAVALHRPLNFLTSGRAAVGISSVAKAMRIVAEQGINGAQVDFYDNRSIGKLGNPK